MEAPTKSTTPFHPIPSDTLVTHLQPARKPETLARPSGQRWTGGPRERGLTEIGELALAQPAKRTKRRYRVTSRDSAYTVCEEY